MPLFVDKHRPKKLDQLDFHDDLTAMLTKMVDSGAMPHLLVYGPPGAGKKTRVMATLRHLYGNGVSRTKLEHKTFKVKTKTIEVTTLGSNFHIEMNPGDAGIYDRYVVQDVIKQIASSRQLDAGKQKSFKVVILNEVDRLTKDAQAALRRTMEKYMSTCRLILVCESVSKVIDPLRSRCLAVRVPAPTHDEMMTVMRHVAKKERLQLPDELAAKICLASNRNLRKALLLLEARKVEQYPFDVSKPVLSTDWEVFTDEVAQFICNEQSPDRLKRVRGKIYELLINGIPAEVVMETLSRCLLDKVDDTMKHEISKWAAIYEHRMQQGSKPIFHIEAFVAKFMAIYKRSLLEMQDMFG